MKVNIVGRQDGVEDVNAHNRSPAMPVLVEGSSATSSTTFAAAASTAIWGKGFRVKLDSDN